MRTVINGAALGLLLLAIGCGGGSESVRTPALFSAQNEAQPLAMTPAPLSLPTPAPVPVPVNPAALPPPPAGGPPPKVPIGQPATAVDVARPAQTAPMLARTVFLRGLDAPQDLAFAPDGTLFYTERSKGLAVRRTDGSVARIFAPKELGAMFGVAVDTQFAINRFVYVFLTTERGEPRVIRLRIDAASAGVTERRDILAAGATARAAGEPHVGGALRFGADGWLYIGIGDLLDPDAPQGAAVLGGKLLRVDRDGRPAAGNRSPTGFDARVFAYGLRNPTALALPGREEVFVGEDGAGQDEVTRFSAGANGGWDPRCARLAVTSVASGYCGRPSAERQRPLAAMTDLGRYPNAARPLWTNFNRAQGLAALAFLRGNGWKSWDGALAVAYADGRRVDVLRLGATGGVDEHASMLGTLEHAVRALALGAEGALYVATNGKAGGDEIWRLEPR